jgi:ribosomal protein L20
MKKANIAIDRKVLAHLAAFENDAFKAVVNQVKAAK